MATRDAIMASALVLPLPADCALRAHTGLDYWDGAQKVARYSGLIATVRDLAGELVTLHLTYLEDGAKVRDRESRKILSKLEGHEGCAVRLMPATNELAIA